MDLEQYSVWWAGKFKNYETSEMFSGHLSPLDAALFADIFKFLTVEIKKQDTFEKHSQWLERANELHVKLQRFKFQELTQNQLSPMDINFIIYGLKFLSVDLPKKIEEEKQRWEE